MKIYNDPADYCWVIDRGNGELIRLSWNESSLLYEMMYREIMWDEVEIRREGLEECGANWDKIEASKEEIIDDMVSNVSEITEDDVYSVIQRYVDLEHEV